MGIELVSQPEVGIKILALLREPVKKKEKLLIQTSFTLQENDFVSRPGFALRLGKYPTISLSIYLYIYIYMRLGRNVHWLKSS